MALLALASLVLQIASEFVGKLQSAVSVRARRVELTGMASLVHHGHVVAPFLRWRI